MNFDKANEWLRKNYPKLSDFRIRAISYFLYHTIFLPEEEVLSRDKVSISPSPVGYVYAIASNIKGGNCDIVLLMPEEPEEDV